MPQFAVVLGAMLVVVLEETFSSAMRDVALAGKNLQMMMTKQEV